VSVDPLPLVPLATIAWLYDRRVRTLARRGRRVPVARRLSFHLGLLLLAGALASPIHSIGEERLFWVHMTQHLLLGDIGALAIVAGLDGPLLRPLLAAPGFARLRVLANPLVALPLWSLNLLVWHLPGLYQAALSNELVHAGEHWLFFATGALMWAAVIEPLPGPAWFGSGAKAVYVLVVRTVGAGLATALIWSGRPFYPDYAAGERASGISPLHDQAIGGAIMFVEGGVVTLLVFAWLFLRWSREAELRQGLADEGYDPALAARAARYGRLPLRPAEPPPRPRTASPPAGALSAPLPGAPGRSGAPRRTPPAV
jgi:putative membrane protein